MTVSLKPYPIQLQLSSSSPLGKTLHHQPSYANSTTSGHLSPAFSLTPFDLADYPPIKLEPGRSVDSGGLNVKIPNRPSVPFTPLAPANLLAGVWMSKDHPYFDLPLVRTFSRTPRNGHELPPIMSDCSPQPSMYSLHPSANATTSSHFSDGSNSGCAFADRAMEPATTMTDGSHHPLFSTSLAGSSPVTRTRSEQNQSRWRPGSPWSSGTSHGPTFSPSPLRLLQLGDESFESPVTLVNAADLANAVPIMYSDGLYSPDVLLASSFNSPLDLSPSSDVHLNRLNVTNLYLSSPASASGTASLDFQHGSPLAAMDDVAFSSDYALGSCYGVETDSLPTRSPQDALLEFSDCGDGSENFTLFPSHLSNNENGVKFQTELAANKSLSSLLPPDVAMLPQQIRPLPRISGYSDQPALSLPLESHHSSVSDLDDDDVGSTDLPLFPALTTLSKPFNTTTGEGTYSCTYHGCLLRFATPTLLQKHKREGHRQHHGLTGLRKNVDFTGHHNANPIVDSQAGPHHCDRINPSTHKPCRAIFSRPYDLTRHEDTIHNARKTKSRCQHCVEEKTFSRADALRRHYRVCHPHVDIVPKQRRRPNNSSSSSVDSKPPM